MINYWRKIIASPKGPKSSTTRHVCLTLSLYMNKAGGSCFPSTQTLSCATGLSERAVCQHLKIAVDDGWLTKSPSGKIGQAWKGNQYHARIPEALTQGQYLDDKGTDGESVPFNEGTDPGSKKVLTEGQCNYPVELNSKYIVEIVTYLNNQTGKNFSASTKQTQSHINARWGEGFRVDDFKQVIDNKVRTWGTDSKWSAFLRPQTLFGTKFEAYLNETPKVIQQYTAPKDFDFENQFKSP